MVRFKNRYVLVEINSPSEEFLSKEINVNILANALKDSINQNYGDLGLAKVSFSLQVKYLNMVSKIAILRVAREYIDILTNAIFFLTQISGQKVKLRQLHVSGTIKKIEIQARNILNLWLNSVLKKSSVTKSIEEELNQMVNQEIEILSKMDQ